MTDTRLYLLMGLPGAGKTTAAKLIEELTGATRLTSDEVRSELWESPTFTEDEHRKLYEYLNEKTARLLSEGKSVVYDANLNRFVHREEKYLLAERLNCKTVLIYVQTEHEIAKNRRISESGHHHLVPTSEDPESMFERVAGTIEYPKQDEPCIVINGTLITKEYIKEQLRL